MIRLKQWLRIASKGEKEKLARDAGTTLSYLYALSNPKSRYGRKPSQKLAIRLVDAAAVARASNEYLPELSLRQVIEGN